MNLARRVIADRDSIGAVDIGAVLASTSRLEDMMSLLGKFLIEAAH
jgi:hypothetical protein